MGSRALPGSTSNILRGTPAVTAVPFTLAGWFTADGINGDCPMGLFASGSAHSFRISGQSSQVVRLIAQDSTTSNCDTVNTMGAGGVWHHLAIICATQTDRRIILNGDLANMGTNTGNRAPANINRISFGSNDGSTPGSPFTGLLSLPALWGVGLDNNEVVMLSKGMHPTRVRPSALVGMWPCLWNTVLADICKGNALAIQGTVNTSALVPAVQGLPPALM